LFFLPLTRKGESGLTPDLPHARSWRTPSAAPFAKVQPKAKTAHIQASHFRGSSGLGSTGRFAPGLSFPKVEVPWSAEIKL
jgi:hypothetical protein